jgi:putative F0F1-ATPase subunit (Ca2+/Mg2+ transporter)
MACNASLTSPGPFTPPRRFASLPAPCSRLRPRAAAGALLRPTRKNGPPGVEGAHHAAAGLQFALTILAFLGIGFWLDSKLGTSPWLLLALTFVGFAGAFYSLVRRIFPPGDGKGPSR